MSWDEQAEKLLVEQMNVFEGGFGQAKAQKVAKWQKIIAKALEKAHAAGRGSGARAAKPFVMQMDPETARWMMSILAMVRVLRETPPSEHNIVIHQLLILDEKLAQAEDGETD